ncbi:MAG: hypothetical protein AAF074_05755 [Pseudomonadota bacterium]
MTLASLCRRVAVATLFGLCLLSAAPPASHAAARAPEAAARPEDRARLDRLTRLAVELRQTGMVSAAKIAELTGGPDGASPFDPDLGGRVPSDTIWSHFFSGAGTYLAEIGAEAPVAAYYNPFVDAWLITAWADLDTAPRLVRADFMLGEAMEGLSAHRIDPTPYWLRPVESSAYTALRSQTRLRLDSFEARFPVDGTGLSQSGPEAGGPLERRLFYRRSVTLLERLSQLPKRPGIMRVVGPMLEAVRAGDRAAIEAQAGAQSIAPTLAEILDLPETTRSNFAPAAFIEDEENAFLFVGDPQQGRVFLAFAFDYREGADPVLRAAAPFEIEGTEE